MGTKIENYAEWVKNLREGVYDINYYRYKGETKPAQYRVWVEKRPIRELNGDQLLFVNEGGDWLRPEQFKNRVDFQAVFTATPEQDTEAKNSLVSRFTEDELRAVLNHFGFNMNAPHKLAYLQHKAKCAVSLVHPM